MSAVCDILFLLSVQRMSDVRRHGTIPSHGVCAWIFPPQIWMPKLHEVQGQCHTLQRWCCKDNERAGGRTQSNSLVRARSLLDGSQALAFEHVERRDNGRVPSWKHSVMAVVSWECAFMRCETLFRKKISRHQPKAFF